MRYNYKYDLPPIKVKFKVEQDGKEIAVPQCDFIVRFYVDGYEGRHYDCVHKGEDYINCEPTEDGSMLICYLNNHRLGIGELGAEFHYIRTDEHYSDGNQHTVAVIDNSELGIELVEGNGDTDVESAVEVTLPFIYRDAYDIAKRHGYDGDADTFYTALASIVDIANAEEQRVSAENERRNAESERESTFESMQDEFTGMMFSATDATNKANEAATRANNAATNAEQVTSNFQTFERQARADEQNRRNNEAERQSNEDTRMQNEIARNTKEAERILAEQHREEVFAQQTLDLQNKADRNNPLQNIQAGVIGANQSLNTPLLNVGGLEVESTNDKLTVDGEFVAMRSDVKSLESVVIANDAKQQQLVIDTANGLMTEIDKKANKTDLNSYAKKNDSSQTITANMTNAVTMKAEEVWLGDNEDVLTTENGILTLNGEPIKGGGGGGDSYTKEESDAKFATKDGLSELSEIVNTNLEDIADLQSGKASIIRSEITTRLMPGRPMQYSSALSVEQITGHINNGNIVIWTLFEREIEAHLFDGGVIGSYIDENSAVMHRIVQESGNSVTVTDVEMQGGGEPVDAYTKAETDAKFAKLDNTSQTISVAQILLGKDKYDMWTDEDGYLWVNGEKYVSEGNEATHLVAEKVTSPQVNTDAVLFSENEDVLDVQGGKLKLNGESVSEEEVYIGSGTPPSEAKIVIDPSEDLVEIVQEQGSATDKVMSQKAVTDAIANIPSGGGGEWEEIYNEVHPANTAISLNFGTSSQIKRLFVVITTTYKTGGSGMAWARLGSVASCYFSGSFSAVTTLEFDLSSLKVPFFYHTASNNTQVGGSMSLHTANGECDGSEPITFTATNTNFGNDVTIKAYAIRR